MMDLAPARRNLDMRLAQLRRNDELRPPPKGWIRAIRQALGMTTVQMARRMGVSQPRIVELEQSEARRTVTLKSLERAAEALGCTLVYAMVPNTPLDAQVRARAKLVASAHMKAAAHSMRLEDQGTAAHVQDHETAELVEELINRKPSRLWDT